MDIENSIRNLAKSEYWQTLFRSSKEIDGIFLFNNKNNFSGIQLLFLYWLQVYSMLYEELSSQEWSNLYLKTIEDNIICDAFLYWRSKEIENKTREYRREENSLSRKKNKSFDEENSFKIYKGSPTKVK